MKPHPKAMKAMKRGVTHTWKQKRTLKARLLLLKSISGTTRFALMMAMHEADRPLTMSALSRAVRKPTSVVSHQLLALKKAGLVNRRKAGREVRYTLHNHRLESLLGLR